MSITEETAFVVLFILASACVPFMIKPMNECSKCCLDWFHNSKEVSPENGPNENRLDAPMLLGQHV